MRGLVWLRRGLVGRWLWALSLSLGLLLGADLRAEGEHTQHWKPTQEARRQPVPSGWSSLRTTWFELGFEASQRGVAEKLAERVDGWYEDVSRQAGIEPRGPITLLLAHSQAAFDQVQPGRAPAWAVGTAWAGWDLIVVKLPQAVNNTDYSLRQTTVHEIAHIVLDEAFSGGNVPRWLHEGLAMYVSGETVWTTRARLSAAVLTGTMLPLSDLDQGFHGGAADASAAYAQSLEFLSWLMDEFGSDAVKALIGRLARGEQLPAALEGLTGATLPELEERWRDHLKTDFAWLPALTTGGGLWVVASALLLVGWWRKRGQTAERRAKAEEEEALVYGGAQTTPIVPAAAAAPLMASSRQSALPPGEGALFNAQLEGDDEGEDSDEHDAYDARSDDLSGHQRELYSRSAFRHGLEEDEEPPPSGRWLH